MKKFLYFISGSIFGVGLIISGMSNPQKVLSFLDIFGNWDPSLMFVMIGAISITAIYFTAIKKKSTKLSIDKKLVVEAGSTSFWYKYVGSNGDIIGINSFGESAPGDKLLEYFGFSSENVVERAEMLMKN